MDVLMTKRWFAPSDLTLPMKGRLVMQRFREDQWRSPILSIPIDHRETPEHESPGREAPGRDALGWSAAFAEQAALRCGPLGTAARVTGVDRGWLVLLNETGVFRAQLSGTFMHQASGAAARPCVGDWVCVQRSDAAAPGSVHAVLDRKTSLRRKAVGKAAVDQMIAANMDCVIVVQSCHTDFNLKRLERYLTMVAEGGALPWVLLTKTDLVGPDVLSDQMAQIRGAGIAAPVLTLSNVTQAGIEDLKRMLVPGKTYCFVGSSGVGKSTLINALIGHAQQDTKSVSGTGEGRHTTVRRELIVLENGAMVIDNPGMREFGIQGADAGIEGGFADILALAPQCRFNDCTHVSEPGCAVRAAVNTGDIARGHYENFVKLTQESKSPAPSSGEKRKTDRAAGRSMKSGKRNR
jgi:ribosome biogenesis GTPase